MPEAPIDCPVSLPRLAIVYGGGSSSPMDLAAAIDGLCEIVWVVRANDPSLGSLWRLLPRLGSVVDIADLSLADAAKRLAQEHVDGIIAFSDGQLGMAAAMGATLGLAHNSIVVVERLTDKYLQRRTLREAGIPTPQFALIREDCTPPEIRELVEPMQFPVVVKPTRGTGSRSTYCLEDPETLVKLIETLGDERDGFVVEEYLADRVAPQYQSLGDYVSVEMMVIDANPMPLAVTGKFPLAEPFRETGNFMPCVLNKAEELAVRELAVLASRALDVRWGALHIEVKLTPTGPYIIEVNGRIGGGGIDGIYQLVHGQSLTSHAVKAALGGERSEIGGREITSTSGSSFIFEYFVQAPMFATCLEKIDGIDNLRQLPGIRKIDIKKSPLDNVDWRIGSLDYVLSVQGESLGEAALRSVPQIVGNTVHISYL